MPSGDRHDGRERRAGRERERRLPAREEAAVRDQRNDDRQGQCREQRELDSLRRWRASRLERSRVNPARGYLTFQR